MAYIKHPLKRFFYVCLISITALSAPLSRAQDTPVIIRDTEIEATFKEWMAPLLGAANLGPESVNFILVQSPAVNAFVAGGANMFFYTGLIDKTDGPGEIIGVMAHELGHISGGHLISTRQALERASYESILGTVVGIGAAVLTGNGGAASAVISGSNNVAQRRFLAHTRVNESSADQAGIRFLETAQINPEGLSSFLGKLESQDLLPTDQQSEYIRTHPLTRNRIEALQTGLQKSAYKDQAMPADWIEKHARMKAKLLSFTNPGRVPWVYDDNDKSVSARYARAIAAYRQNEVDKALSGIDELMALEPENPYFMELKGQMLRDFGRVQEAIPYYRKAADKMPKAGLIQIDLGHALLESGDEANFKEAIDTLEKGLQNEPRSSRAHRLLATAYGRQGDENMAKLHLAEEAVLQGRLDYAKELINAALNGFDEGSRAWIKAKDLLAHIDMTQSQPGYEPNNRR